MDHYIDQIRGTYDAGFPYAALMLSLAVPDICSSLEIKAALSGKSDVKARYFRWYKHYMRDFRFLSAQDCWSLRCGVMHQGRMGNKDRDFDKIFFSLGYGQTIVDGISDGLNETGKIIGVSLPLFIEAICQAIQGWNAEKCSDPTVAVNLEHMFKFHKNGFPSAVPGIWLSTGAPCIA